MSAIYWLIITICLLIIGWLELAAVSLFCGGVSVFKNFDNAVNRKSIK